MRVLIIDQDKAIADGLGFVLNERGAVYDHASTGQEGLELARVYDYDIIVLDVLLSDMQGLDIIYRLRSMGLSTPLLVTTANNDPEICIESLNIGADDFMVKPFHTREFMARIQAIVRRSQGHSASAIEVGDLKIDLRRHLAEVRDTPVDLTGKEYAILELLAVRKGVMISKEMFLNHLYSGMDEPEIKIIDVFICRLRKKIAILTGGKNFIKTLWGRGYMLVDPDEEAVKISKAS